MSGPERRRVRRRTRDVRTLALVLALPTAVPALGAVPDPAAEPAGLAERAEAVVALTPKPATDERIVEDAR